MGWRTDATSSTPTSHLDEVPAGELLAQLATQREELRQFRANEQSRLAARQARVARGEAVTTRARKAAVAERTEARTAYARFQKRMEREQAAHAEAARQERAALDAERARLAAGATALDAQRAEFVTQSHAQQRRLQDAWQALAAERQRLLGEQQEIEFTLSKHFNGVQARDAHLIALTDELTGRRDALLAQIDELRAESARLDVRAVNARAALKRLEARRDAEQAPADGTSVAIEVTGIGAPASPDALMFFEEVSQRDRELRRENTALATARDELERKAADVFDHRLVIAEQVATLAVAQHRWQATEFEALAEMEDLALALAHRESQVEHREHAMAGEDAARLGRAQDLWRLHLRLEAWQSTLAAREATAAAERERGQAEASARRSQLEQWEASLADLGRQWAATRRHELGQLRGELQHWADERGRHRLAHAEVDELRQRLLADVERVAAVALAHDETKAADADGRRLRVLRKKWERHFRHFQRDLDRRRAGLDAAASGADDRLKELTATVTLAAEHHEIRMAEHDAAALDRLAKARELDGRAAALTVESAHAGRAAGELAALRAEVHRMAHVLATVRPPTDEVVALVPVNC